MDDYDNISWKSNTYTARCYSVLPVTYYPLKYTLIYEQMHYSIMKLLYIVQDIAAANDNNE